MEKKIRKSFEIDEGGSRFILKEKDAGNWQMAISSDSGASLQDIAETICNILNGRYEEITEKIKRLHFEFKKGEGTYRTEFFEPGCSIQDIFQRLAPKILVRW